MQLRTINNGIKKKKMLKFFAVVVAVLLLSSSSSVVVVSAQSPAVDQDDAAKAATNPAAAQLLSQMLFNRFSNFSAILSKDMTKRLDFCITDVDAEWNNAFNFSKHPEFLSECLQGTRDAMQRLCTAAEVKYYGDSLLQVAEAAAGGKISRGSTFIAPNKNCNLSAWPSGCEPGWACGTGTDDPVDLKSKTIPTRISQCGPCCAGFFCPPGLTCMIPCPLGSYCPTANSTEPLEFAIRININYLLGQTLLAVQQIFGPIT